MLQKRTKLQISVQKRHDQRGTWCGRQGWRAFYKANGGAIPIECQAGRAAMGMEAEATRLVEMSEGEE